MTVLKTIKEKQKQKKLQRTFKASDSDWDELQELANKFTGGNRSEWIRYAALAHRPDRSEISRS